MSGAELALASVVIPPMPGATPERPVIDLDAREQRWAPPLLCGGIWGHLSPAGHPCAREFNHPADRFGHICRCAAEAILEQRWVCGVPA